MQNLKRTLEFGSMRVELEVRAESGFDNYAERFLFRRMYELVMGKPYEAAEEWGAEALALNNLIPAINRTVHVTGIPISWPNAKSQDKDLCAAWEYLMVMPGAIWQGWLTALGDVDQPPGDPELFPPEHLTDGQKKAKE